jgi:tetratricopeptide (TPR) repeat protein
MRGCIVLFVAIATLPAAVRAQDAKQEAIERFDKGVDLFKQGNFGGALVEFRAAYEAQPHYKVRYNIGVTLYKLNRYVEAEQELEAYPEEAGEDVEEDRRQEVQSVLYEIASYIGLLSVSCSVEGASLHVDGRLAGSLPGESIKLDVGEHYLEVTAEVYRPYEEQITLPGGKLVTRSVTLEPLPSTEKGPCGSDEDCGEYERCHAGLCVPGELMKGRGLVIAGTF